MKKRGFSLLLIMAVITVLTLPLLCGADTTAKAAVTTTKKGLTLSESGVDFEYSFLAVGTDLNGAILKVCLSERTTIYTTDSSKHTVTTNIGSTITIGQGYASYVHRGTTVSFSDAKKDTLIYLPDGFGDIMSYSGTADCEAAFGLGQLKKRERKADLFSYPFTVKQLAVGDDLSGATLMFSAWARGEYRHRLYISSTPFRSVITSNGLMTLGEEKFNITYKGKTTELGSLEKGERLTLPDDFGVISSISSMAEDSFAQIYIMTFTCSWDNEDCECLDECDENCDYCNPTDPTDPTDPTEPTDPTDPTEPGDTDDTDDTDKTKSLTITIVSAAAIGLIAAFAVIKLKK